MVSLSSGATVSGSASITPCASSTRSRLSSAPFTWPSASSSAAFSSSVIASPPSTRSRSSCAFSSAALSAEVAFVSSSPATGSVSAAMGFTVTSSVVWLPALSVAFTPERLPLNWGCTMMVAVPVSLAITVCSVPSSPSV